MTIAERLLLREQREFDAEMVRRGNQPLPSEPVPFFGHFHLAVSKCAVDWLEGYKEKHIRTIGDLAIARSRIANRVLDDFPSAELEDLREEGTMFEINPTGWPEMTLRINTNELMLWAISDLARGIGDATEFGNVNDEIALAAADSLDHAIYYMGEIYGVDPRVQQASRLMLLRSGREQE